MGGEGGGGHASAPGYASHPRRSPLAAGAALRPWQPARPSLRGAIAKHRGPGRRRGSCRRRSGQRPPGGLLRRGPGLHGRSLGEAHADSIVRALEIAGGAGNPLVGFIESGGARLQEGHAALAGYGRIFRASVKLSRRSPQISIVSGVSAGGGAYAPALTDFVVMTEDARMFLTGPRVVRAALGEEISMEDWAAPGSTSETASARSSPATTPARSSGFGCCSASCPRRSATSRRMPIRFRPRFATPRRWCRRRRASTTSAT